MMSTTFATDGFVAQDLQTNEFDYRPTPVIVPVAIALGLLAASSLLGVVGILVAIIGVIIGSMAVITVKRSDGMYGGLWGALVGLSLSVGFAVAGIGSQVYAFNTEVPEGYRRTSFSQEISAKGFVVENGRRTIHPEVASLIDQQLFVKGYMYPQRQNEGLVEFLLLKDTGECCFGGQPDPTDMILVQMVDDKTVNYRQGRVAVSGVLKLTQDTTPEGLEPVYALEAVNCEKSRSAF